MKPQKLAEKCIYLWSFVWKCLKKSVCCVK